MNLFKGLKEIGEKAQRGVKEGLTKVPFVNELKDISELGARHVIALSKNMSEAEMTVDEATNNEPWGPHGSTMSKLAEYCHDPKKCREVLGMVSKKLQEKDENWRQCYKALLLLEYLIKAGPESLVAEVRGDLTLVIDLRDQFQYKDPKGYDLGANVRHRARLFLQLLNDPAALQLERDRASQAKGKAKDGLSSEQYRRAAGIEEASGAADASHNGSSGAAPSTADDPAAFDVEFPAFEADFGDPAAAAPPPFSFSLPTEDTEEVTWSGPPPESETARDRERRQPRRLADTKINPALAASFAPRLAAGAGPGAAGAAGQAQGQGGQAGVGRPAPPS